jgi:hypothetical protein
MVVDKFIEVRDENGGAASAASRGRRNHQQMITGDRISSHAPDT